MTPTHCVTLRTTIFKSIANTFDMNAMVGCGLRQLKMLRPAAYASTCFVAVMSTNVMTAPSITLSSRR
jgi:hypothetical protein